VREGREGERERGIEGGREIRKEREGERRTCKDLVIADTVQLVYSADAKLVVNDQVMQITPN
jgi:hypothetical protein